MNLEFDDDATHVIDEAARLFASASTTPGDGLEGKPLSTHELLAGAGWAELGAALAAGQLEFAVAVGVFREAGRYLLGEQLVTSFLLSTLGSHADAPGRHELSSRLARIPGLILGDGRRPTFDVAAATEGFCFGSVAGRVDTYRLNKAGEGVLALEVLENGHIDVEPLAGLALHAAVVTTTGGSWRPFLLDLDGEGVRQIAARAELLHSATLLGCAERLLHDARDFTLGRTQFGVPIGSFQAVKHGLADVHTANTVAWNAILCAAADGAHDHGRAAIARLLVIDAALAAARAAAQFHGGIAFTWEFPVHYHLKAVLDGTQRFGSADEVGVRIAKAFMAAAC